MVFVVTLFLLACVLIALATPFGAKARQNFIFWNGLWQAIGRITLYNSPLPLPKAIVSVSPSQTTYYPPYCGYVDGPWLNIVEYVHVRRVFCIQHLSVEGLFQRPSLNSISDFILSLSTEAYWHHSIFRCKQINTLHFPSSTLFFKDCFALCSICEAHGESTAFRLLHLTHF